MLTIFEATYLQERQRVEATSQDNRWEFDRKALFGDLHHMKRILTDIFEMAKASFYLHAYEIIKVIFAEFQCIKVLSIGAN
ncbi:unnamed protein product [Protopolystoma xenopodis]|uniref:Dynein heavy chain tail domain-containing protein n=1 Tax=Protopolystoma xenopodis TaxID=117903 RepID=A0A3S5AMH5_9PLAT|nr:unnamed protein product [Protopolystoma xenopodis]